MFARLGEDDGELSPLALLSSYEHRVLVPAAVRLVLPVSVPHSWFFWCPERCSKKFSYLFVHTSCAAGTDHKQKFILKSSCCNVLDFCVYDFLDGSGILEFWDVTQGCRHANVVSSSGRLRGYLCCGV